MATLTIRVEGMKDLQAALRRANPGQNPRITPEILKALAGPVLRNAKDKQIAAGGRGKKKALKPLPHRLTSRTGHGRRSIHINTGPLPRAIEVGTDEAYMTVHEFGGGVGFPSRIVKSHTRSVAFGRKVAPFTVPQHFRSGYYANYPKRPFLAPALAFVSPRFGEIAIKEWRKQAGL